jgi:hypothetical protein
MSSWERARHIPWDRIPQDGSNLEHQKEKIFRQLQRETVEDELSQQEGRTIEPSVGESSTSTAKSTKIPYSNMELLRQAAFGGCVGSISGSVFGFMDSMRTVADQPILANASNAAKGRYILQGTTRSATIFGVFFGGFQVLKYGVRVAMDPGDVAEIGVAGAASMGALMIKPAFRPSMPYAAMLVIMDGVSIAMRKMD